MIDFDIIDTHINARAKLDKLIEIVNTGVMNDVGDYIDTLSEAESKILLRMIVYGSWKQFE